MQWETSITVCTFDDSKNDKQNSANDDSISTNQT